MSSAAVLPNTSGDSLKKRQQPSKPSIKKEPGCDDGNVNENKRRGDRKNHKSSSSKSRFVEYITPSEVQEGLKSGTLFEGILHVNQQNRQLAFVVLDDPVKQKLQHDMDVRISGEARRNRALHGDKVVIKIDERSEWTERKISLNQHQRCDEPGGEYEDEANDGNEEENVPSDSFKKVFQPTGRVVAIKEKSKKRDFVGFLTTSRENGVIDQADQHCIFIPLDKRCPRMVVPLSQCPESFKTNPNGHGMELYVVQFVTWNEKSTLPYGKLIKHLGRAGNLETDLESIIIDFEVDTSSYTEKVIDEIKSDLNIQSTNDWTIPVEELEKRKDARGERVFTIDPKHAKDLDDAISISKLNDNLFRVGIHIADASYFVAAGSKLDRIAQRRATSVYLEHLIVPMLPHFLSDDICSLLPSKDRLAFSIYVLLDANGELVKDQESVFQKSVVRSCAKLSYEIAQQVIGGEIKSDSEISQDICPREGDIFCPNLGGSLVEDITMLHKLAMKRRESRLESGTLSLNKPRIQLELSEDNQSVKSINVKEEKESNNMIEELMLLANYLAAEKLLKSSNDTVLLRSHGSPLEKKMSDFIDFCNSAKLDINVESAAELDNSLRSITDTEVSAVVNLEATKAMQTAKYFAYSDKNNCLSTHHYALNVPYYTHFTSPIRRYSDIIVHRQLESALFASPIPYTYELKKLIDICNKKSTLAKKAEEQTKHIYFCRYIEENPEIAKVSGIIRGLSGKTIRVVVPHFSLECKLPIDSFRSRIKDKKHDKETGILHWTWTETEQEEKLRLFDKLPVRLYVKRFNPIPEICISLDK
ncbi:predicted protein [Naegleria gruberi]|uniref:Predicted protein n=1 Tax=Naegleria gruberi TaxID=5762 RepID=D2VQ85_NAEGR|nr:uncharacterized protein NAEGRDRAFT_80815 [Naegleria gruberi]EFC41001.1 predicted protein [Naegleria gruberi]|eukprot:XP_002673745.1 predicted protein [Naegleria gruberi strain NEG-M]